MLGLRRGRGDRWWQTPQSGAVELCSLTRLCPPPCEGQPVAPSRSPSGDGDRASAPGTAVSLNAFRAIRCSAVVPSCDAAAATNQSFPVHVPSAVPKVSQPLPSTAVLCGPTPPPSCPVSAPGSGVADPSRSSQQGLDMPSP